MCTFLIFEPNIICDFMGINPLPRKLKWRERDGKTDKNAHVIKEVVSKQSYSWGDFYRVIQLIQESDGKTNTVRFGYYVKDHGEPDKKYRWGSQYGLTMERDEANKFIERARKEGIL